MRVALDTGVPVLNGVLAVHGSAEQAAARTGGRARQPRRRGRARRRSRWRALRAEVAPRALRSRTALAAARARSAFRVAYLADVTGDTYRAAWTARREEERLNDDQVELIEDVVDGARGAWRRTSTPASPPPPSAGRSSA